MKLIALTAVATLSVAACGGGSPPLGSTLPRCVGLEFRTTRSSNQWDILLANTSDKAYRSVEVFVGGVDTTGGAKHTIGGYRTVIDKIDSGETVPLTGDNSSSTMLTKRDGSPWIRSTMKATSATVTAQKVCESTFSEE